jgi:hypothetical protein
MPEYKKAAKLREYFINALFDLPYLSSAYKEDDRTLDINEFKKTLCDVNTPSDEIMENCLGHIFRDYVFIFVKHFIGKDPADTTNSTLVWPFDIDAGNTNNNIICVKNADIEVRRPMRQKGVVLCRYVSYNDHVPHYRLILCNGQPWIDLSVDSIFHTLFRLDLYRQITL